MATEPQHSATDKRFHYTIWAGLVFLVNFFGVNYITSIPAFEESSPSGAVLLALVFVLIANIPSLQTWYSIYGDWPNLIVLGYVLCCVFLMGVCVAFMIGSPLSVVLMLGASITSGVFVSMQFRDRLDETSGSDS